MIYILVENETGIVKYASETKIVVEDNLSRILDEDGLPITNISDLNASNATVYTVDAVPDKPEEKVLAVTTPIRVPLAERVPLTDRTYLGSRYTFNNGTFTPIEVSLRR